MVPTHISSDIQTGFPDTRTRILTAFGFLRSTCQHKIIHLFNIGNEPNLGMIKAWAVTLLNKNTPGSWKYIHGDLDYSKYLTYHPSFGNSISVNGVIYRQKIYDVQTGANKLIYKVLTLDLEGEEFRFLACPSGYKKKLCLESLVDLNGIVCLVDVMHFEHVLDIWILKDSKNEIWANEYTVNFDPRELGYRSIVPFAVIGGDGEKKIIFETWPGSFYLYNMRDTTFTKLQVGKESMGYCPDKFVFMAVYLHVD